MRLSPVKISFHREPNVLRWLTEGGALGIDPVVVAKSNLVVPYYFFLLIETAKKSGNSVAGVPCFVLQMNGIPSVW